ncbi:MAG: hypothetical protein JSR33_06580 [Proteobacteria bacterium]|nr:hypothetical protein [Pseudomonadota bacterium]
MMKLIFFLIVICLTAWGGWELYQGSGYLLIAFRQWQIETGLLTAFILLLLAFVILYLLIRIIVRSSQWPKQLRQWKKSHRMRRAEKFNQLASCALIEEKWALAEEYFDKASQYPTEPLISYMGAAIAAQNQNHIQKRDHYIGLAHTTFPEAEIPLGILQAKLQIQGQQWQEARTTLSKLQSVAPQHPVIKHLASLILQNSADL